MIELSKIRLVNWYGFSSMTVPIGAFTLIAGKNGNGKSVLLDAIKYALYGDTVFNKSTEKRRTKKMKKLIAVAALAICASGCVMTRNDTIASALTLDVTSPEPWSIKTPSAISAPG